MCSSKDSKEANETVPGAAERGSSPTVPEVTGDKAPDETGDGAHMVPGGEEPAPAVQANETEEMTDEAELSPVVPEEEEATRVVQANETKEMADEAEASPVAPEQGK